MRNKTTWIILLIGFLLAGTGSFAFVPRLINYQGIITDTGGNPIDGAHDLTFRIYPDSLAVTPYWTELHSSVDVNDGLFNVVLGRFTSIPDTLLAGGERWMGITVDLDGEMTPKTRLTSVPWAFRAAVAESALVSAGITAHDHDDRYYTESELNTPGTINEPSNPVDWSVLKNVPAGIADGVDDTGGGAGDGHSLDAADGSPVDMVYVDDDGNVGIGTVSPLAALHIAEGLTVVCGVDTMSNGGKMMWLASKEAFRAGRNYNNSWHPDSAIGLYSFAGGYGTAAMGEASVALGRATIANGEGAVALGRSSWALKIGSTALGQGSVANGDYATAAGFETEASNTYAVAMGNGATASGVAATAMGGNTTASGDHSTALGQDTEASGNASTAMGISTTASNSQSVAMGYSCTASGTRSVAAGEGCQATGTHSFAMGLDCIASGLSSTAIGEGAEATGYWSTALGRETKAEALNCTAIGRWNVGGGNPTWPDATNPVFEVGIGTLAARENAMTVLNNGYVGIGTATPDNDLHVDGVVQIGSVETLSDIGLNLLGCRADFAPDADGARDLGTSSYRWNTVYAVNGTINTSDARLKENVAELRYGLAEVMQLRPVSFRWRDFPEDGTRLGLVAQEVRPVISEVVADTEIATTEDPGGDKRVTKPAENLGISYSELIPVLIKAIQEQQSLIQAQAKRIDELEARISR